MAVDDYVDSEVALAVAATAAIFSPPVRALLRRGAVGGLAGLLTVADLAQSVAKVVEHGITLTTTRASPGLEDITDRPPETAAPGGDQGA